jgi:hypothetical protein
MAQPTIEERLTALESEVAELRNKVATDEKTEEIPWWHKIRGAFKDDPDYEEAMRLGREYRESLRPKDGEEEAA